MKKQFSKIINHPLSPFRKKALGAILVLAIVIAIGTFGLMLIEGWDIVTSFYFMSFLATAEGPAQSPATWQGKIFASFMAFFSIGAALSAIAFAFGPLFGAAMHVGFHYVEREEKKLKERLEDKSPNGRIDE